MGLREWLMVANLVVDLIFVCGVGVLIYIIYIMNKSIPQGNEQDRLKEK